MNQVIWLYNFLISLFVCNIISIPKQPGLTCNVGQVLLTRVLGDDICDDEANNEACEYDKGDCCLSDTESKKYCKECLCKVKEEPKTCDVPARNLGDDYCDDEANNEACEFDKGDCCLLDSESKKYCKECLCKVKEEPKTCDVP